MTLTTSQSFASIAAAGSDWRSVTRQLLEDLAPLRQRDVPFNLGFLYVSDHLAKDVDNILSMMRSVTGIESWVGTVGFGVFSCNETYLDTPAAAILVGAFPLESFCVFPVSDPTLSTARNILEPWLEKTEAMLTFVHGDPYAEADPVRVLAELDRLIGGFSVGGLAAARGPHVVIADQVDSGGVGGVVFSADLPVVTALSQGCVPIGPTHTITKAQGNVIIELDGQPAFDVFTHDLKSIALRDTAYDPDTVMVHDVIVEDGPEDLSPDVARLFKGEIHIAFPVKGSDSNDYTVRNFIGADAQNGSLRVSQPVYDGETIMFVHRDDRTTRDDLIQTLLTLRERVIKDVGKFQPQAGIYVSCAARARTDFRPDLSNNTQRKEGANPALGNEMALIKSILGEVPLAGFYASGEISNQQLYGYTGVLILFL